MCRGCRLHFMLRPTCLLPVARLAPPGGLLTPRSGTKVSLGCLGPATRRSDAYRDGTLTRWTCAACSSISSPSRVQSSLCFVTHHASILGRQPRASVRVDQRLSDATRATRSAIRTDQLPSDYGPENPDTSGGSWARRPTSRERWLGSKQGLKTRTPSYPQAGKLSPGLSGRLQPGSRTLPQPCPDDWCRESGRRTG